MCRSCAVVEDSIDESNTQGKPTEKQLKLLRAKVEKAAVLATRAAASSLPAPVLVLFIDAFVSPSVVGQLDRVYDFVSYGCRGSSPAGCNPFTSKRLLIVMNLKNWLEFRVSSSFYPHFSCSQSDDFSAGSYGSPAPIDPNFQCPRNFFAEPPARNARDLAAIATESTSPRLDLRTYSGSP